MLIIRAFLGIPFGFFIFLGISAKLKKKTELFRNFRDAGQPITKAVTARDFTLYHTILTFNDP